MLLDGVGQLVSEEALALGGVRFVAAGREVDILFAGESAGVQVARQLTGVGSGVDLDPAEVAAEACLEIGASRRVQRFASPAQRFDPGFGARPDRTALVWAAAGAGRWMAWPAPGLDPPHPPAVGRVAPRRACA